MQAKIALVERNAGLRASASRVFFAAGFHLEPYETPDEFAQDRRRPDLVLVHDEGDALNEVIAALLAREGWCPIAAYASDASIDRVSEVLSAGVVEYFAWPIDEASLERRVQTALGKRGKLAELYHRAFAARGFFRRLSVREKEILMAVARGLSNKQIGRELAISSRTVECHRANLHGKIRKGQWTTPAEVAFYLRVPSIADVAAEEDALGISTLPRPDAER